MPTYQSPWDALQAASGPQSPLWTPFFASPIDTDPAAFGSTSFSSPGLNSVLSDLLLHFDGGEASTTFTDSSLGFISGGGHTVSGFGGIEQKSAAAVFGASGCRFVAASSQYLSLADDPAWDILASVNWFIEFRYKPTSVAGGTVYMPMAHFQDASNRWGIEQDGSQLSFFVVPGGPIVRVDAPGVLTTDWQTIGIERFNGTVYLYRNGVIVASGGISSTATFTAPLFIGQRGDGINYFFDGDMDELRLQHREGPQGSNYIVNTAAYAT